MMLSSGFWRKTNGLLMLICLASLLSAEVRAAAVPLEEIWQPNGPVRAVEMAKGEGANTVYIGGDFTYVGPETGSAVVVSSTNNMAFDLQFVGTGPDPVGVHVSITGANDSWYIGGNFTQVIDSNGDSHDRNYLAEIDTEGNVLPWNPSVNGVVHALLLDSANSTLYVGGEFTLVNVAATSPTTPVSQARNYLAAFDTLTNENNVTIWDPNLNGFVYALAHVPAIPPTDARLYVGGDFTGIDNIAPSNRNRIARLKINQATHVVGGYDDGWNPDVNGLVRTLVFDGVDRLYAGGDFSTVNIGFTAANALMSRDRGRLAVFDTTTTDDNAYPWSPSANASVHTLGLLGDSLYIGGDFSMIDSGEWFGFSVINVADVSSANATIVAWDGSRLPFLGADELNISVREIMFRGSFMYVVSNGMHATDLATDPRPVSRMAALDPTNGDVSWSVDSSGGVINTISLVDGLFFIAGTFESGGGRIRSHVAELSLSTGAERGKATGWDLFVDGPVHSIVSSNDGEKIYIGGDFSAVGPNLEARNNIALLSGSSNDIEPWSASITDVDSVADAIVRAMVLSPDQTKLYVGGKFDQIGIESRSNIAALNTTVNGANGVGVLNDAWQPGTNGDVHALVASSDELVYVGGDFSIVGGDFNSNVTALRAGNGRPLSIDGLWAVDNVNGIVRSLALSRDNKMLYLGGDFTEIVDETATYNALGFVAALDVDPESDKWRVVPTFNPVVTGGTGIYSLALSTDDQMLWLSGDFSNAAGSPRNHVARYNLSEPLLTEWNPDISTGNVVYAMGRNPDDSLMVVAGDFNTVGSSPAIPRNNLAIFDTARPTVTNHVVGGFYNTSPLDIVLSCTHNSTAGPCTIFYTLDGTEPKQQTALSEIYVQPPPAPPEPPPPSRIDKIEKDAEVKFFAKDAHGTVSEINSASYGIDKDYPTTIVQPSVLLKDILHADTYKEISSTGIEVALVCEDGGGANCDKTYYTTDGSAPNNEDGTPSDKAQLYRSPLTPKQLLPLDSYTLEDLVGDERDVFREMTLADIVNSTEQAAVRIDLDAFTLADIPDIAVARNSIELSRVLEFVDLAAVRIDSIPGNILANVIASADIPDGAETFADIGADNLDLTQITLGSISRTAYSLADIPASYTPPPTYITASQVPLIQVALDRSENHIVLDAVRLDTITLEQIPAEFIPRTRLYGFIELQFFSIDRAGNSEADMEDSVEGDGRGVKREIYYIDIGSPETNATPNTGDNVFTSEIHVVLECYDYGDTVSGFSKLPDDVAAATATGSGCREGGTYYTIGGGLPTPSEVGTGGATKVYTGPITISSASVLRFLSIDELGNEEISGFEVYAFTFSSVGQSGVGASGLMVWLFALLGLLLRWRSVRTRLH